MHCDQCKDAIYPGRGAEGLAGSYCSSTCRFRREPLYYKITKLLERDCQVLAYDLYCLATHGDCPQWVRDSAEAIFQDLTK